MRREGQPNAGEWGRGQAGDDEGCAVADFVDERLEVLMDEDVEVRVEEEDGHGGARVMGAGRVDGYCLETERR